MRAQRFTLLARKLPPGYGLTKSVPADPSCRYSYSTPDHAQNEDGFASIRSVLKAAERHFYLSHGHGV